MRRVALAAVLAGAVWPPSAGRAQEPGAAEACAPAADMAFVCGPERPEDLVRLPGSRWLVASGFSPGAGLKLVDTRTRTARFWYTGEAAQLRPDRTAYPHCPGPPDPAVFNTRGLNLRRIARDRYRLHVVNHGGRESVEVFDVETRSRRPQLTWTGCLPMPDRHPGNSVATTPDGTVLVSVLNRPGTTIADYVRGGITGGVYQWRPQEGAFRPLPGTELPGNNGLETSADGKEFYVVAFGWRAVVAYSLADTRVPLRRIEAPGFMPDNIHRDGDRLLAAGMRYDEPACGGTRKIIDGVADPMLCHRGSIAASLDPKSGEWRMVYDGPPNPGFNGASTAVRVGRNLWLGSFQASRLAVVARGRR